MAWISWGLLLSFGMFLFPVCVSAELQQSQSGFSRLYVLQPGPGPGTAGADGGVRVSSISTLHGPSGQPHTYNVALTANFGGQVRSRRMGKQAASAPQQQPVVRQEQSQKQLVKLSGVNVCGGQCCHGWSKAQGSQRCTMPNCIPQCHNGGMCLRPQHCVCKPGSEGKACEQKTVPTHPFPPRPGNAPTNGHNVVPHRPIPQQVLPNGYASAPSPASNMGQMKLTVKPAPQFVRPHYIQQHIQQQIRPVPVHPGQNQQYIIKPKYYHRHTTHTQTHIQTQPERPIPLTVGHNPIHGNHTGRIKVVFTPTVCKLTCIGGRCHNNCERGNTTTIISENGHATDTLTAPNFRVVVCHLPCVNGGKCSTRDKCQCPPNFTGKFCHMAVPNGHQQTSGGYTQTQVHSTHTLPLTYSNGQTPGIVNIHINHPPEASVQFHQVSHLDNYHNNGHQTKGSSSSTSFSYHHSESSQKSQHLGYNIVYPGQHSYQFPQYQPVTSKNTLGRCFQETAGSQCGKALPILTKLEQCCGTIGTSWGFHKCQKCPKKPSFPLIDCPQGYKRVNSSHCQDLDECHLQGVCPNGICVNTLGSYRCLCKAGYVPDPTFTTCIPETPAVQEEKGACYRLVSSGRQCLHPVSAQLSKQLCCCSVGKAWGPRCDKCPPPGTAKFKEICPGGMGYTVLPNPPVNKPVYQEPIDPLPPQPLPTPERPVEAFGTPEEIIPVVTGAPEQELVIPVDSFSPVVEPIQPQLSPGVSTIKMEATYPEVVERASPPAPVEILPANAGQDIALTQSAEVDECHINPYICGHGICYNTAESYICHCDEGYLLDDAQTTCMDIDECQDQSVCVRGHCQNTEGSFICVCGPGFRRSPAGDQCDDVNECIEEARPCKEVGECVNDLGSYTCICPQGYRQINGTSCRDVDECADEAELCSLHGKCLNTEGSYQCLCDSGFTASLDTPSCDDIDECGLNETICGPHGFCENRLGSFRCLCDQGYQESWDGHSCVDVNECELLSSVCGEAQCINKDGTFQCECPSGQEYNVMIAKCEPVPTASSVERKECYYRLNDENLCESVLTSHVTLQECCCTLGAGWGDNCEVHPCPVNGTDQFKQMCPSGRGFIPSGDLQYGDPTLIYKDADECKMFDQEVCKGGFCLDTVGSYECYCKTGQDYDPINLECRDQPEMDLDFEGICWQAVTDMTCTQPLGPDKKTTYTECCCLHGYAWGMQCALCPHRDTEDYATICNLPLSGGPRPYGRDALVAGPVHEYEVSPDYSPSPEELPYYDTEEYPYRAFEGLRAEECGILNGCENGRCVRVQEGYTCDCFDGYTLDLSRMACIDVNECSELNNRMSLCKNAKCINTVGSYRCVCLPGFKASDKPNYCVEAEKQQTSTHTVSMD